ncbi:MULTISPECIES: RNA methyltransferase [unclassified Roseitalea]|uniref:TrmH family RNA methyltransferase n=1 Tax=unclassified Roseitalea TaxID=2639107 RepID=UPI00273D3598|nr:MULTISPECIES: RNA methyltransferase [unclassified Roseitalea]
MTVTEITDPDDPRLAAYRDIRERDLVRRDGRFVAEGTTVLNVLARQQRFAVESALILKNRLAGLSDLLADLPADVPVYSAPRAVIDAVAGFPIHRGVLAIGHRRRDCDGPPAHADLRSWTTVVALCGLANHDNVGAVFRNAVALGADAVVMDAASCDPLYRKALRVSVGGVLVLPWHRFESTTAMADFLAGHGFALVGLSPSGTGRLESWTPPARTALVLGTEGAGLPPDILARAQTLRIAMARDFDSLNVATSAALVLHHMRAFSAR